ncbi:UNVERIFIED_CONTAM: hypothetical protein Slati_2913900 [Sesamum latifolium]|uniref:SWIM-type domain-containing protein n=1 Tax=Sesamum latifolium TaxID=2727402 RepID=A0AAW2VI58_9LAMI
MTEAAECIHMKSDDWHFQIMGPFDQHNVDLLNRSCNCRRWSLTGIPCRHTISAIWCRNEDPHDYVHDVYKVSTYLRCYEHVPQGVNGAELWPKCELPPPLPPKYENKPGRSKKMRRRQPDEPLAAANTTKMKKCQKILRYGKCGVVGDNARTCNKSSGQLEEMPTGTSQPPSTQESNHSQPTSTIQCTVCNNTSKKEKTTCYSIFKNQFSSYCKGRDELSHPPKFEGGPWYSTNRKGTIQP